MLRLRRRAWLIAELAVIVIAVAVWWFGFWAPGQARKHDALDAFDGYAATMPAAQREGRDVVSHEDTTYLVCSRRASTEQGVRHLCLSIRTDRPVKQRVVGGYTVVTTGLDLPAGTKTDCFGSETGECLGGSS